MATVTSRASTIVVASLLAALCAATLCIAASCPPAAAQDAPQNSPIPDPPPTVNAPEVGRAPTPPEPSGLSREVLPAFPALTSGKVEVDWNDLRRLLDYAADQGAARLPETESAPIPWSITDLEYSANAAESGAVEIEAQARLHVWQEEGWLLVPLFAEDIALAAFTVDGSPAALGKDDSGRWCLPLRGCGDYALKWSLAAPHDADGGASSFRFASPVATPTTLKVLAPVKGVSITSPQASAIRAAETADGVVATLTVRPSESFEVQWTRPLPTPVGAPAVAEAKPHIVCTIDHAHIVSETHTFSKARLTYQILRGEASSLRFELPDAVSILSVESQEAVWNRSQRDGTQLVDVQGNHPWTGSVSVLVTYEAPHAQAEAGTERRAVPIVPVQALDVARQSGNVAICAQGNVELTPDTAQALTRIDPAELPADAVGAPGLPVLMAFRYADAQPTLALSMRRLQDVAVRPAIIDQALLASVLTEHGTTFTRATYKVRNNAQQFLRVTLPVGATVESASVKGAPVKPAREDGSDAVLVPLATQGNGAVVDVEVVYSIEVAPASGLTATAELVAPSVDLAVQSVQWEVYLPEHRALLRSAGDLERIPTARTGRARLDLNVMGAHPSTVMQLREGVERFFITDINNPAAAAHMGRGDRYSGPPVPLRPAGAVSGILPTAVMLPTMGEPIRFARMFLTQEEAPELTLVLYDDRVDYAGRWALLIGGAALAGLLGATGVACARVRRVRVAPFAAALLTSVLATIALLWTDVGWASVTVALALGLATGLIIGARPARTAPATEPSHEGEA